MTTDMITLLDNPSFIAFIIVGFIASVEFGLIVRIRNICRTYSKMMVLKGKILADGDITLDDADIIPFVKDTVSLMEQLEAITHWIWGYILNHPSTGWFRAYAPKLEAINDSVIEQLAKDDTNIKQNDNDQQTESVSQVTRLPK